VVLQIDGVVVASTFEASIFGSVLKDSRTMVYVIAQPKVLYALSEYITQIEIDGETKVLKQFA
jgi:hypothetical protein